MKVFAKIMSVTGILILLGTCAVFVMAQRGTIQIDQKHIQSVVFIALGMAFLCMAPSKYVVWQEAKTADQDEKGTASAWMAFVLNVSAGIILIILSLWKYWRT